MGKLGKMQGKIAKAELGSLVAGKDTADDQASAAEQKAASGMVGNVVGAQQQIINSQAAAATGGSPQMVGAQRQAAANLGGASADAAVKQTSESNRLKDALREKRKASTLNLAANVKAQRQADAGLAISAALGAAEVASDTAVGLANPAAAATGQ